MTKSIPDPNLRTPSWARRAFLRAGLMVPALFATSGALVPTPASADPDETPTPSAGEGPFFTPRSPERATLLEPGVAGTPIDLSGRVLDTRGRPVPRALLDFWHADASGQYDTQGFRFRGHQYAGADGSFRLRTIVPGSYGPPRHYHVKVRAERGTALTTQLLFPGDERNGGPLDDRLLMAVDDGHARFDFVLDLG
jgi:protocatechuate 3,4-dioxygenase beta subunit